MKIQLIGHPYYYEIVQEAKQFFWLEPFQQASSVEDEDAWIVSELRPAKKRAGRVRRLVVTKVRYRGRVFETRLLYDYLLKEGEGRLPGEGASQSDFTAGVPAGEATSRLRSAVKRSLYLTLYKATGKKLVWGSLCGVRPAKRALSMLMGGKAGREVLKELRDFYVSKEKARLALEVGQAERDLLYQIPENSISLYIAIPFCPSRCLYCSFFSAQIPRDERPVLDYLSALSFEMEQAAELIREQGLTLASVYIGGGTPSSLSSGQLELLLEQIKKTFDFSRCIEYTVECGRPDTVTERKLSLLKRYGVTRISINPQTMHEQTLRLLGRSHTPQEIRDTFALAEKAGFDEINCDVIAAIPSETREMFQDTLEQVLALSPSNVTVHTLSVKRSSLLYERIREFELPDAQETDRMLTDAYQTLTARGYRPYYLYRQKNMVGSLENVGYAKPGRGCLYNVLMMEEVGSVLGLGAGSVTKRISGGGAKIQRAFNVKQPEDYVRRVSEMAQRKRMLFCPDAP